VLLFARLKVQREIQVVVLKFGQPTALFMTDATSEPFLLGAVIVVMSQRLAIVRRLIPKNPGGPDSPQSSARKFSGALDCVDRSSGLEP
jgi:hypothetical protein